MKLRLFITLALSLLMLSCMQEEFFTEIDALTAQSIIENEKSSDSFVVLDLRTPEERALGYIEGSVLLDYKAEGFGDELAKLDTSTTYLIHCAKGGRSSATYTMMQDLQFRRVYHLTGGFDEWQNAGLPITKN